MGQSHAGRNGSLVEAARQWVVDNYPYNREHLVRALELLDRIAPGSAEAVRLAALTHDMERAFPAADQAVSIRLVDPEYDKVHAARSAAIVGRWLRDQQADSGLVDEVERLIVAHETGGWPEADLVQAADSLSFLETNVDLFISFVKSGRFSPQEVGLKFRHSYDRIRLPDWQALAAPRLKEAEARLAVVAAAMPATRS
jgi:hypothetical protein